MQVRSASSEPVSNFRANAEPWVFALVWLLFCAAMVAIALFLTPRIGAGYASADLAIPDVSPEPALDDAAIELAIPMAATVLYPNEPATSGIKH